MVRQWRGLPQFYRDGGGGASAGTSFAGILGLSDVSGFTAANPQLARNADSYFGLRANSPARSAYPAPLGLGTLRADTTLFLDIQQ